MELTFKKLREVIGLNGLFLGEEKKIQILSININFLPVNVVVGKNKTYVNFSNDSKLHSRHL